MFLQAGCMDALPLPVAQWTATKYWRHIIGLHYTNLILTFQRNYYRVIVTSSKRPSIDICAAGLGRQWSLSGIRSCRLQRYGTRRLPSQRCPTHCTRQRRWPRPQRRGGLLVVRQHGRRVRAPVRRRPGHWGTNPAADPRPRDGGRVLAVSGCQRPRTVSYSCLHPGNIAWFNRYAGQTKTLCIHSGFTPHT